jgi:hypothetical protein
MVVDYNQNAGHDIFATKFMNRNYEDEKSSKNVKLYNTKNGITDLEGS